MFGSERSVSRPAKKTIVQFTWVNEQLFFERNEENELFGQTLSTKNLLQAKH